ncbi:fatty acid desaturase [Sphaerisporangium sp. NPDC005289]|uniref:fatty acid desaturase family protein n=1 Tax=Sphaerisporangium sp. NPDC005289 TaxID=3155247 RepID=UPI0033ABCE21
MRVWKNTPKDALLLGFSVAQLAVMLWLATTWNGASIPWRVASTAGVAVLISYNIIVVSHLFTHVPWFVSARLNAVVSLLNSINIGQSVQAYHLTHVRNHHRFNNDRIGEDGTTRDRSSTYRSGKDGEHSPLLRYAVSGALDSLVGCGREIFHVHRLWRIGDDEEILLSLASRREPRRGRELLQIRADRAAHCLSLVLFAAVSWQWALMSYLPAFFLALTMVNVQNYYRHYGADPGDRAADSVSHYSRLYNALTFNDGYHQEHHLSPGSHWSQLPAVRERFRARLDGRTRIVSPVPAMLGFLHIRRSLLHHGSAGGPR